MSSTRATKIMRVLAAGAAMVLVAFPAVWGALALCYQAPGGRLGQVSSIVLWVAFSIAVLLLMWHGRPVLGLLGFAAAFVALLFWWRQIEPSNHRLWADDVAQMTTGDIDGNRVTLHNVRNFDWRSNTDYTQRWETRSYDLERLRSVDMILSYWSIHAIAHVLISFGFDDGAQVVFSVEIRPEKSEGFSEIGGFFKEFELSIIAADERDVIRVRTNVRGEDDYLYRIKLPEAEIRSLFLAYIAEANSLARTPRFYNTITSNCTTLVYHLAKHIVGHLPLDIRLLLSGYLPEYVYGVGGLDTRHPLEELRARGRITERAHESDRSESFSADIRIGVPVL
jgi:Domain of unknown function (DUF4105)